MRFWSADGQRPQSLNGKVYKKDFTDPKNYDDKEEFLCIQLISHVIGYPSKDPWNSLETYGQPCILHQVSILKDTNKEQINFV